MKVEQFLTAEKITQLAKDRFQEERNVKHLEGWFFAKEIMRDCDQKYQLDPDCIRIAKTEKKVMEQIPLWLSKHQVFAGTQDDSFARSYALINPAFTVDSFSGYCDPVAVFGDIDETEQVVNPDGNVVPNSKITKERISALRDYNNHTLYADQLRKAYDIAGDSTSEAIFFIEQVTGHLIPDVRPMLQHGTSFLKAKILEQQANTSDVSKRDYYTAMYLSLESLEILASRYQKMAEEKASKLTGEDANRFALMASTLKRIPMQGASNLYEAIQAFILIWQTMCLEQTPNPFAFSVGNADRIFEPYRAKENTDRELSASLLKHLLVFFNVADRSWAISQNLIVGGKSNQGVDLTNMTSYALLDAYFDMNLPQPILSVKLHKNTPDELYENLGRFFFTPGILTPSLFNDDAVFEVLENVSHVDPEDLQDYAIAGCQEPLIMGKDNGNTTNSWLNLGKILELSINDGVSTITGKRLGRTDIENGYDNKLSLLQNIRCVFYENVNRYVDQMVASANAASEAISILQVPFLSTLMGGIESGIDVRNPKLQGTKYNGSGCLIHGLSVVADSFIAIDYLLKESPQDADRLVHALQTNFEDDEALREYLHTCPKYGNNIAKVDQEAALIANKVCDIISSRKNYLGNPFRADFSTPSTHLLYGFWVGATPDGRKSREMLGYGVDPLFGDANQGMGFRMLSAFQLPFDRMNGGYASHLGINPGYFKTKTMEEKGMEFKKKIFNPLFFNDSSANTPFYLYVNVTTPEMLRKVLAEPKKYAPSGVYIVRIHGTFVNFLDLSPAIQEDIIKRLDPASTSFS